MSKDVEQAQLTNIKGYFNPNSYRVNVNVSELNISFPLESQQFIKIRATGQKVNDPIFDRFVGARMLSPELSSKPVPVVRIPRNVVPVQAQPGYVVGQGHRDATGKWVPPVSSAQPDGASTAQPVVSNSPSIKGMSIEEARRQGFIGKQRIVPENYGAPENDGAPTRGDNIPVIKYSMEAPAPRARGNAQLPTELMEQVRPEVAPVLQQLTGQAASNPEAVDLSRKAAERAVRAQQGPTGVVQFRKTVQAVKATAAKVIAQPIPPAKVVAIPVEATPTAPPVAETVAPAPAPLPAPALPPVPVPPKRTVAEMLPPPPIEEMGEMNESPLVGGTGEDLPQPDVEEAPTPIETVPEAQPKPTKEDLEQAQEYVCGGCGKKYQFKSWFVRHLKQRHSDRLQELMPPD